MEYTEEELKQIFENNFDCYADTTDNSVVLAMSMERYIETLTKLNILKDKDNTFECNICHTLRNNEGCNICGAEN